MAALDLRCNFIHWFQAFVLSVVCKPERGAITVSWSGVICAVFFPMALDPGVIQAALLQVADAIKAAAQAAQTATQAQAAGSQGISPGSKPGSNVD